ncbi:universal stress family protein [delta proteobacterium NaphS2]|nr:universal stress family protein [delta proteobacterium NaphS2]
MEKSILVAISDSASSRAVLDCVETLFLNDKEVKITLCHIFRQPSASSELMGKKFTAKETKRREAILLDARARIVNWGGDPARIHTLLAAEPYPTVADGIIDQQKKYHYDIIVIGRKKMSKAEEFVMGDASVRLVRAIEDASILVVKTRQK